MKKKHVIFIICFISISIIPLILLPIFGFSSAENSKTETDGKSSNILQVFEKRYPLRQEMVTGNSILKTMFLKDYTDQDVILGKEGWMFYKSTLDDYLGVETLSDKQLEKIVHNLALLEKELEKKNTNFIFVIAPNKNSLYPQYMPDGYLVKNENKNVKRLQKKLKLKNNINLFELFKDKEVLYHKTDSHWNNKGALMVSQKIIQEMGLESKNYEKPVVRNDFTGDLFTMLYPSLKGDEPEYYFDKDFEYKYNKPVSSNYDNEINTNNPNKEGNIMVCRDSFFNSLLPFVANEFKNAYFTREIPYPIYKAVEKKADNLIFEIVERHLHYLQEYAPIIAVEEEKIELPQTKKKDDSIEIQVEKEDKGSQKFLKISGKIKGKKDISDMYFVVRKDNEEKIYPVFYISKDKKEDFGEVYLDLKEKGQYEISALYKESGSLVWQEEEKIYIEKEGVAEEKKISPNKVKSKLKEFKGENIEELIKIIGQPTNKTLTPSCETEGEDGIFEWKEFIIYSQSQKVGGDQKIVDYEIK